MVRAAELRCLFAIQPPMFGIATAARIPTITTTVMSSNRENPWVLVIWGFMDVPLS
jgi:hypothetical protein